MSDCPFPNHYRADDDGICFSSTCPVREDCPGVDTEPVDENPALTAVLDGMERKLVAMQAEIAMLNIAVKGLMRNESELQAALGRWVEGVEGGDRA